MIQFSTSTLFDRQAFLWQAIQLYETVLIQTTQFCIVFVYTQLNVKPVLYLTVHLNIEKQFYFKQFSLA